LNYLKQTFNLIFINFKPFLFFINKFYNGGNLAFHLEKLKRFEEEWVQFYSAQISCALLFLHEKKYLNL
jgi:serine/threonine protein kinase